MQTYNFDYYQYKKKINKKSKLAFPFLIIIILILLITAMLVKPKNLGEIEFYFVEVGSFATYKDAYTLSLEIQQKGGAGYVHFDGEYRVLASYYSTETEAESVVKNLSSDYPKAIVYALSSVKKVNTNNLNSNLAECVLELSNFCLKNIDSISDLILQHDKSEMQTSTLKLELKKLATEFEEPYNNFINLTKKDANQNVAKDYLTTIYSTLSSMQDFETAEYANAKLKYDLIKIIVNYCSFIESF